MKIEREGDESRRRFLYLPDKILFSKHSWNHAEQPHTWECPRFEWTRFFTNLFIQFHRKYVNMPTIGYYRNCTSLPLIEAIGCLSHRPGCWSIAFGYKLDMGPRWIFILIVLYNDISCHIASIILLENEVVPPQTSAHGGKRRFHSLDGWLLATNIGDIVIL